VRHFLLWWTVVALMLATLAATFAAGAILLGYVAQIAFDPARSFQAAWHPWLAVPVGVFTAGGSAWLFGYGLIILGGVVRASKRLAAERVAGHG
jgi:hypothetical protein